MEAIVANFRLRLATTPQPVALALGRICRHPNSKELIEAALKASEVLARYAAALAVSSFCARDDGAAKIPSELKEFRGNLSFGHFLAVLKGIARSPAVHPLKTSLETGFGEGTDGEKAFDKLVGLRNELGHALSTITDAKAAHILEHNQPLENLAAAVQACQRLLDFPLFLLEEQRMVKRVVQGRRLLLMGEAEPTPDFIDLESALGDEDKQLYVALKTGALRLPPFLLWDIVEARQSYGIYLLHRAEEKKMKYLTVHNDGIERAKPAVEFETLVSGGLRPLETVALKEGGDLLSEWLAMRKVLLEMAQPAIGPIPWNELDDKTLTWYDSKLKSGAKPEDRPKRAGSVMVKMLLDGRTTLTNDELRQLVLLFGKEKAVAARVKRALVDCRARRRDSEARWDERKESSANVIESLKVAVEFFSRHIAVEGATLDGLQGTSGSADYIAMREALVNLFIHQDYTHPGQAGQVEIRDERTIFYNAGASLVSPEGLLDGGKSTSRNAVISRALKLIGFAELSGSGLYAVHNLWRKAHGVPPKIETSTEANTFTLTFEWLLPVEEVDEFWKEKLGVKLTGKQADIISLLAKHGASTLEQIAAAGKLSADDAKAAIDYLALQGLVEGVDGKFTLRADLAQLAANRGQASG
ncbi:MAG: ATP-binding protein [Chthoniobacter sp.]|uniref:ATP-binding protein n=1 Tax=Chthoniobacter sp. TaxID=2510640 RepID=UPI0032A3B7A3